MSTDLLDSEFTELDELLATTPAPLQALNACMLDGYLCGVLVQPRLIEIDEWLPNIFDYDGGLLPAASRLLKPNMRSPRRLTQSVAENLILVAGGLVT